jgi:hypothetical protein
MAVFEELNRQSERLQDPEARKAEKIARAQPAKRKKRNGSSSVSIDTYKRTKIIVNIAVALAVAAVIIFGGYYAIQAFIN